MSDIAVKVEGLGKKFIIGHQKSGDLRNAFGDRINRLFHVGSQSKEHFWALKDINFEIKKGEAVGIIGRNGAGKSTLLKILSRITEPTKGRFEINGRVSSLLEVGTGFHMELTGRENVFLNGTILGMKRSEIRRKFDEIVAFSGVEKFLDTPVKHYSSGMKVRLAFSVAAHLEPEILIVDEVLAVGDAEFQKKCLGKMNEVSKDEGRTILFVSHNMGAVLKLCKTGIVLVKGQVLLIDKSVKAIDSYLNWNSSYVIEKDNINRKGYQDVSIKSLVFLNRHGNEVNDIFTGQSIDIVLEYSSEFDVIKELIIGLSIQNNQGQFLTVLNNKMANYEFKNVNGTGKVICTLRKIPFMHGKHFINLKLYANGEPQDIIEGVRNFNVENNDFYGSNFNNAGQRQGIYIKQEWKIY